MTKAPGTAFARVLSREAVSAIWAEAAEHEVAIGYSPADIMELTVRQIKSRTSNSCHVGCVGGHASNTVGSEHAASADQRFGECARTICRNEVHVSTLAC